MIIEIVNQETVIDVNGETFTAEVLVTNYSDELIAQYALEAQEAAQEAEANATIATNQAIIATNQALLASAARLNAQNAANAAEASEDAAALSATSALASEQASAISESNASISASNALASEDAADLDAIATAADRVQTGLDRIATGLDRIATTADRVQTGIDANTATTQAGIATTQAGNALTSANNAAASAASAASAALNTPLTGFATGTNTTILATDTTLQAFGKTQGQINERIGGTVGVGQVAFGTGTKLLGGDNGLFWDNTNKRLGIGTNAPPHIFTVSSSIPNTTIGLYNQISNANNRNWAVSSNVISYGDFSISQSNAINGNPISAGTQRLYISLTGNIGIGTTTDAGFRLDVNGTARVQGIQVIGDTLLKGSGNTSATTALSVQNSDGTALFSVRNDNVINIGLRPATQIYPTAFGSVQNITGRGISMSFIASDTGYEPLTLTHGNLTSTANGYIVFNTIGTFNPTSGTATYTANRIGSTINQTGGANGITRGLLVNPTLTAAADWRSIEWSNNTGRGLWGAGTANNAMAGALNIGSATNAVASAMLEVTSTTRGFLPPRMTSSQRDLIATPATGLMVYNTTDNRPSFYNGTTWINL